MASVGERPCQPGQGGAAWSTLVVVLAARTTWDNRTPKLEAAPEVIFPNVLYFKGQTLKPRRIL